MERNERYSLSSVVVPLLKGVLYQEASPEPWKSLLALQARVRDYVGVLGLELILNEAEGYAFLRSRPEENDQDAEGKNNAKIPRLIVRRQLSYPVSLLLALLRKKLAEFDAGGGDTRLVLSRDEIVETVRLFLPESGNEARVMDQVDAHINKIVQLGFLRPLRGQEKTYEVLRILTAFVDAQWLSDFGRHLNEYRNYVSGTKEYDADD